MTSPSILTDYVQGRDPEAFRRMVESHHTMVYSVCRRKLIATEDVEDAVQEVFLKLVRQAETIRSDLAAWLHTCAVHSSIDIIRRNKVREQKVAGLAVNQKEKVQDKELFSEILAEVDQALLELSDADRSLIVKYYLENQTQQAIAENLSITQSGVKRRIDRAINRLRVVLGQRNVLASTPLIATLLAKEAAATVVPETLKISLLKIGIAGVGPKAGASTAIAMPAATLITAVTTGFYVNKLAVSIVLAVLGVVGVTVTVLVKNHEPAVSSEIVLENIAGSQFANLVIRTIPAASYYQDSAQLTGNLADFSNITDQFYQSISTDGYRPVGPAILIYPDGIDDPKHSRILYSTEVVAVREDPDSSRMVEVPAYLCCLYSTPILDDDIPALVVEATERLRKAGYQRTKLDRLSFDYAPNGTRGSPIGVQIGIRKILE